MNDPTRETTKKMANLANSADLLAQLRERRAVLIRRFVEAPPCGTEAPPISLLTPIATIHGAIEALEAVEAEAGDRALHPNRGEA